MNDTDNAGATSCALGALLMTSRALNDALNRGQHVSYSITAGEREDGSPDGGCKIVVEVEALAPGAPPNYRPCGIV